MIATKFLTTNIMPQSYSSAYTDSWQALFHGTLTFPIALTIIMYLVLLYTLTGNTANKNKSASDEDMKSLTSMIQNITIGTMVCYIPFIIWTQYNVAEIKNKTSHEVLNTTGRVS